MTRNKPARFLSNYIDPKTGRERLGSGADSQCFHYYANVKNVIKFGLAKPAFPAGQYNIYSWPEGSGYGPDACKFITVAYKRA
jgi:hypothetical protein